MPLFLILSSYQFLGITACFVLGRTLAHILNSNDGYTANLAILAMLAGRVEASGLLSIFLFMLFFCLKTELAGNLASEKSHGGFL
jgi:hypothetical protein